MSNVEAFKTKLKTKIEMSKLRIITQARLFGFDSSPTDLENTTGRIDTTHGASTDRISAKMRLSVVA